MIMLTILLVIDSMFEPINLPQFMSHRKKKTPVIKWPSNSTNIFHGNRNRRFKKDKVRTFVRQLLV